MNIEIQSFPQGLHDLSLQYIRRLLLRLCSVVPNLTRVRVVVRTVPVHGEPKQTTCVATLEFEDGSRLFAEGVDRGVHTAVERSVEQAWTLCLAARRDSHVRLRAGAAVGALVHEGGNP